MDNEGASLSRTPLGGHKLFGARLHRIDSRERFVLAITLRHDAQTRVLTFFQQNDRAEACLLELRPRGEPANSFAQKARRTISNGRLLNIERLDSRRIRLSVARGEHRLFLVFVSRQSRSSFILSDSSHRVLARFGPDSSHEPSELQSELPTSTLSREELERNAVTHWENRAKDSFATERSRLLKRLRAGRKRISRKIKAISADMSRIEECETLRHEAQLILANLQTIQKGATTVEVQDWSATPPAPRTLHLLPHLAPKAQAEKRFVRARKLERGYNVAQTRLQIAESELQTIIEAVSRVERATDAQELDYCLTALRKIGIRVDASVTPGKRSTKFTQERRPYRAYRSSDGLLILVGRGGHDNDRVTLDHARPHDRWLHARGTPGAHVVIKLAKNQDCPAATLLDAATLAAHFSKHCRDAVVDVQHTERRYVRKPKGAAPGSVTVERERVIACRMEQDRVQRLLSSEESGA